jgi:hypothetical protein
MHRLHRLATPDTTGNPLIPFTWTPSSFADQSLHLLLDLQVHASFSLVLFWMGRPGDGSGQIKRALFQVFVLILKEYMRALDQATK